MPKLSVVIPCFNEEKTIDEIVSRVEVSQLPNGWKKEIVLVDDFSIDGTRNKIVKYSPEHVVVLRKKNGGKGAAVKSGLEKATGDYILIQDADLEYNPDDYERLIGALSEKTPIVFGSRLRQENDYFNLVYLYGSKMLTHVFNLFFGCKFTDITTCYKLFPRQVVGNLLLWKENDFVFDAVCLTYELNKFNPNIVEVPIRYSPRGREEGKKVNWRHGVKSLMLMMEIR
ncbi:MAG: glycosyltransferase family 2 protein, partial [Minisyncoccota bacterium]